MMTIDERRRLSDLAFPLTVYRGGVGDARWISEGTCWTTDIGVSDFCARISPSRWKIEGDPHILSAQVDRPDVSALFDDRQEGEVVICGGLSLNRVVEVPFPQIARGQLADEGTQAYNPLDTDPSDEEQVKS